MATNTLVLPSTESELPILKVLPPNHNSPLVTNRASLKPLLPCPPTLQAYPSSANPPLEPPLDPPNPTQSSGPPIPPSSSIPSPPTLAEKLRVKGDKSLKRLAHVTLSETCRPRILIPDSVFQKGAELHKDFIVCHFNGRPPPFNQIQSVLNHMWGKGRRLEIHNNPLQRSAIVRIQSEFLRQKILEKNIWYVGDSMFHTAQWSSEHSSATPSLSSIKIWAHLTGVPLDLRYQHGLSLVAGLIGEPKETDDFTLNLVSLTLSHVKVEVDLTKPLPNVVEFVRQSGEVVEIQVDYPWLPPTCSHCHELGHVVRNCLTFRPPKVPAPPSPPEPPASAAKMKKTSLVNPKRTPHKPVEKMKYVAVKKVAPKPSQTSLSVDQPSSSLSLPSSPLAPKPPLFEAPLPLITSSPTTESPSDKPKKPPLKRSRSSPTFSPPSQPKVSFQSSKTSQIALFPEVGTLKYLSNSSFLSSSLKNPFLPLLNAESLQETGDPSFSS